MKPENISGRIGTRIVGILELLLAIALFGVYIWIILDYDWEILVEKVFDRKSYVLLAILFGIYFISGITMSIILILSTFSIIGLNGRKWIAVSWCLFNMISFVGTVVFMCVSDWCQDINWFLLMVGFLIKLAVFFCIVCTYVWGIFEKIMDQKLYAMPISSPVRRRRRNV